MGLLYFVSISLFVSAFALPKKDRDVYMYNTEFDIHEFQRPFEDPIPMEEMEAQAMVSMLPVKVTRDYIKLDKYQAMAAYKVAKSILKPIIKSKEFRASVKAFEQMLLSLRDDPEIKRNMKEAVDALEEIYYRTDNKLVRDVLTWLIAQYTDEVTARSISSIWNDVGPVVTHWFIEPVVNYYKAWLTPTFSSFKDGLDEFLGEDVSTNVIGRSAGWGDYVDAYIQRVAEMTSHAREMIDTTAQFLEMQDAETAQH